MANSGRNRSSLSSDQKSMPGEGQRPREPEGARIFRPLAEEIGIFAEGPGKSSSATAVELALHLVAPSGLLANLHRLTALQIIDFLVAIIGLPVDPVGLQLRRRAVLWCVRIAVRATGEMAAYIQKRTTRVMATECIRLRPPVRGQISTWRYVQGMMIPR